MPEAYIVEAVRTAGGRRGGRYGLQTMCEGGGVANVTIIENCDWQGDVAQAAE